MLDYLSGSKCLYHPTVIVHDLECMIKKLEEMIIS